MKRLMVSPWAPIVVAYLVRLLILLYFVLLLESQILAVSSATLRSYAFWGALAAFVGSAVLRQVLHLPYAGQTPDMTVHSEVGNFRSDTVAWAACAMRGWRPAMEDAHVAVMLQTPSPWEDAAIFGVLDGHGGRDVSALAAHLLVGEVKACGSSLSSEGARSGRPSLEEALSRALPRLDARLRGGLCGLGQVLPPLLHPFGSQGSTACVAAVDFERREVVVANVGDSRAMLIRNGKALPLSEDHKPENPEERSRIHGAGGQVRKVGPCYRVDGNLNLSRALGDFGLKANRSLPPDKQKVSCVPDTTRTPFVGGAQEVLLVGCDGLFERMSNQDVADQVWRRLRRGMPLEQVGRELLFACCARSRQGHPMELGTDNESVILVKLPLARPDGEGPAAGELRVGQRVNVHGLESESGQALNGQVGVVEGPNDSADRYDVRLVGSGEVKSLKVCNLLPVPAE